MENHMLFSMINTASNSVFFHGHVLAYGGVCEAILEGLFVATFK